MEYVIALGGNAINEMVLGKVAKEVALLYAKGNKIILTHGNGPQVGELALMMKQNLGLLTGMTQTEIGLLIQCAVAKAVRIHAGKNPKVAIVPTRVLVDKNDKEFKDPSKPIGKFYTKAQISGIKVKGYVIKHFINGYRRVVPSPKPTGILELNLINELLKKNYILIAAGGGGITVNNNGDFLNAVIDKDRASSLLARKANADRLIILTNVDGGYLNFKTSKQRLIKKASVKELQRYANMGYFEKGSMLPKIEACIEFVNKTKRSAIIGNISKPHESLRGNGTLIFP